MKLGSDIHGLAGIAVDQNERGSALATGWRVTDGLRTIALTDDADARAYWLSCADVLAIEFRHVAIRAFIVATFRR